MLNDITASVSYVFAVMYVRIFIAPVCFNTTYCEGESVNDDLLSYEQCCFELSGVSFASSGQCLLCPKTGMYVLIINIRM